MERLWVVFLSVICLNSAFHAGFVQGEFCCYFSLYFEDNDVWCAVPTAPTLVVAHCITVCVLCIKPVWSDSPCTQ